MKSSVLGVGGKVKWFVPHMGLILVVLHLVYVIRFSDAPLSDPGTGWHLKVGELIYERGEVGATDVFSYTAEEKRWINYQWFFQYGLGVLQAVGGVRLVVLVYAFLFGLLGYLIFQQMINRDVNFYLAMFLAVSGYLVLTMHAMVRPHVMTYLFFSILVGYLRRMYEGEGERIDWKMGAVVGMFLLWCNMHGGFVVGLAVTGLFFGASFLRWGWSWWWRDGNERALRTCCRMLILFVSVCAVTLINPYGVGLHIHIWEFLGEDVLKYWHEFQPPDLRSPSLNIAIFEGVLVFTVIAMLWGGLLRRVGLADILVGLFLLVFALKSVRHVNLFIIAMIPWLGVMIQQLVVHYGRGRNETRAGGFTQLLKGYRVAGVQLLVVGVLWVGWGLVKKDAIRGDLRGLHLSAGSVEYIREHLDVVGNIYNEDSLGGSLIYEFGSELKVFVDDRADLYGARFMREVYLPVFFVEEGWENILKRYEVDSAILVKGTPLSVAMEESENWVREFGDEKVEIFFRWKK